MLINSLVSISQTLYKGHGGRLSAADSHPLPSSSVAQSWSGGQGRGRALPPTAMALSSPGKDHGHQGPTGGQRIYRWSHAYV